MAMARVPTKEELRAENEALDAIVRRITHQSWWWPKSD